MDNLHEKSGAALPDDEGPALKEILQFMLDRGDGAERISKNVFTLCRVRELIAQAEPKNAIEPATESAKEPIR